MAGVSPSTIIGAAIGGAVALLVVGGVVVGLLIAKCRRDGRQMQHDQRSTFTASLSAVDDATELHSSLNTLMFVFDFAQFDVSFAMQMEIRVQSTVL
jgi:hypothetical protein